MKCTANIKPEAAEEFTRLSANAPRQRSAMDHFKDMAEEIDNHVISPE